MTAPQKLGFIGLGIMGTPMAAATCAKAGHELFVTTRSKVPAEVTDGRRHAPAPDAKSVAQQADIVFMMVPDTPDVEKVLFGETASPPACRRARRSST